MSAGQGGVERGGESDAPCAEETRLLWEFWNLYWNGPGSADYGDHAGYTWADVQALDDAAALVEEHGLSHPCRRTNPTTSPGQPRGES